MRRVFLWFYCLPIWEAVMLILLATVAFLLLREKFGTKPGWKIGMFLLFFFWIAVIFFGTLGQRTEGGNLSEPILTPLHSYYAALNSGNKELYRTNFMNAVLFYPAGLLGYEILPKQWKMVWRMLLVTCALALVSIGVEYSQYRFRMGLAEVDDVIHNTLGSLLGALACCAAIKRNHKK